MTDLLLLLNNKEIVLSESIQEDQEEFENAPFLLRSCVLTAVEQLEDKFMKLLKECYPHSNKYVDLYEMFNVVNLLML